MREREETKGRVMSEIRENKKTKNKKKHQVNVWVMSSGGIPWRKSTSNLQKKDNGLMIKSKNGKKWKE